MTGSWPGWRCAVSQAEAVLERLVEQLNGIRRSRGYHTDAGRTVLRMLAQTPSPEGLETPALFVQPGSVTVDAQIRGETRVTLRCDIVGVVAVQGQVSPDSDLLDLLWDIRAACLSSGAFLDVLFSNSSLQLAEAVFRHPEEGQGLAEVSQQVSMTFSERYSVS
jgi:hypothetical protein